jgi:hypothetical protein
MAAAELNASASDTPGELTTVSRGEFSALTTWTIPGFSKLRAKQVWSQPSTVGGYVVRLLLYPRGDSQALPGYLSLYLQVSDSRQPSGKWECFASYRLSVLHARDAAAKSVARDSWHRFSGKKRSHGWCDFTPAGALVDPRTGFCDQDTLSVSAEIIILQESVAFDHLDAGGAAPPAGRADAGEATGAAVAVAAGGGCPVIPSGPDVLSGKFTWRVHNFSLFQARALTPATRRAARQTRHM